LTGRRVQTAQGIEAGQESPQSRSEGSSEPRPDPEALQETTLEDLLSEVTAAALYEQGFVRQVSAGLHALLQALARDPDLAHLAMLEVRQLDPPRYRPYRRMLARLTSLFESMLDEAEIRTPAPQSTAKAVVSGVVSTIAHEIDQGRTSELLDLYPELVFLVLAPYVGTEVAAAETHRCRKHLA
jgi:hypothetical protein